MDKGRQAGGEDDAAFLSPLSRNELRLWLSLIAYILGNLWQAGAAGRDRPLVADQLAAAVG